MVIIIKSNSCLTLLGTSTSNENVIKEAYKWITILNHSQQPSQHEKVGKMRKVLRWRTDEDDNNLCQENVLCKTSQEKKFSPEKRQRYEQCRTVDRRTLILLRTNANLHTLSPAELEASLPLGLLIYPGHHYLWLDLMYQSRGH